MKKLVFGILFALMLSACGKDDDSNTVPPVVDQIEPTLEAPFVSVASTTQFIGFGDTLPGNEISKAYYITLSDTQIRVIAAIDGIIDTVLSSGGNEYEIHLKRVKNSAYTLVYKNVTNPTVSSGTVLESDAIIGKVNSLGKAYFAVKKESAYKCPSLLGNAGFNYAFNQALQLSNIYNNDTSVQTTCLTDDLLQ